MNISVGQVAILTVPCLSNPIGTLGVCYEAYQLGEHRGWCFIFENGNYDGFDEQDVGMFLTLTQRIEPSVADYQFEHVITLSRDFDRGLFTSALTPHSTIMLDDYGT